ncbi:MarR family winged helix-turn-helix transcriptional regulator [Granulosicoccus antarcticus]|uniref:HTH-type transcriptional repressor NicR n=1 Tax=Granulosicoccus antarcticus IMCC3135 TaxID=1192854 RepID=A0A2Z2NJK3_9GAMM|nr:MarR family transcriptional regulator [Granulosicoccus antarcticus]ASJ71359.1 HTH-type transcriptional repressor NicR [Granulosicoccus antarcticus IMCC3135]
MNPELTIPLPEVAETETSERVVQSTDVPASPPLLASEAVEEYLLDEQVGYLLRLANQRHLEIFNDNMPDLTPTQFAVLIRLEREDDISQNELGRRVGIDAATTNGVIDRLARKKLIQTRTDIKDKRRLRISLSSSGRSAVAAAIPIARETTRQTLCQLDTSETVQLIQLLKKMQKI